MNKQELEKIIDENFETGYLNGNNDSIKAFIFNTVIPEVLKDFYNELTETENHKWNDAEHCTCLGGAIYDIKKRAKELYDIDL